MKHAQNIKYGTLSGLLLICTIMLGMAADSHTSVSAQITPAPEKFGSIDDAADSSHDTSNGSENPNGITPSKKIVDTTEEPTDSTDSRGVTSEQITTEQDDGIITTEEQDPDPTNQLVEAIMSEVNEALSAAGIFGP